ncbi:hypothetical protein PR048_011341 [Dryococelus australis]|uniref:Uncharacterized protein n=1 Tax=Dryococelus australis TaxID=614101 RepID=A0ABQ9HLU6_9NEOP|nr:hypothetical protein PR048_011341 [Dryococelus australis]
MKRKSLKGHYKNISIRKLLEFIMNLRKDGYSVSTEMLQFEACKIKHTLTIEPANFRAKNPDLYFPQDHISMKNSRKYKTKLLVVRLMWLLYKKIKIFYRKSAKLIKPLPRLTFLNQLLFHLLVKGLFQ